MEKPPLTPPPPQESIGRGYRFVWRLLLISNLALGAYIFTRPRTKERVRKDKKAKSEVPSTPVIIADTPPSNQTTTTTLIPEPEKKLEAIPENQWSRTFKW